MEKIIVFGFIRSLHDLFTALWIGGLLTTLLAFMPALRGIKENPPASKKVLENYQKSLSVAALVSMVGLWVTGMLLGGQSGNLSSFISFGSPYETLISIKHILVILMVAIALIRRFGLGQKIATFTPSQKKTYAALLMINAILGVVVIFLSGTASTLG